MFNDAFRKQLFCSCTREVNARNQKSLAYVRFLFEYYLDQKGKPSSLVEISFVTAAFLGKWSLEELEVLEDYRQKLKEVLVALYFACLDVPPQNIEHLLHRLEHPDRKPEVDLETVLSRFVQLYPIGEAMRLLIELPRRLYLIGEQNFLLNHKIFSECEGIASLLHVVYEKMGKLPAID